MKNVNESIIKLTKKKINPKYINSIALSLTDKTYTHLAELSEELGITRVTCKTIINKLLEAKIIIKNGQQGRVQLYKVKL